MELFKDQINAKKSIAIVEKNGTKMVQLQNMPNTYINLSLNGFRNLVDIADKFGIINPAEIRQSSDHFYIQDLEKSQPIYLRLLKLSDVIGRSVTDDPYVVDIRKHLPDPMTGAYTTRGWGLCFNLVTWNLMVSRSFPQIKQRLGMEDTLSQILSTIEEEPIDFQQTQDPFDWLVVNSDDSSPTSPSLPPESQLLEAKPDDEIVEIQPSQQPQRKRRRRNKQPCSWLGKIIKLELLDESKFQKEGGDAVQKLSALKPEKVRLMTMIMSAYSKEVMTRSGEDADLTTDDKKTIQKLFEAISKRKDINNIDPAGLYEYCASYYANDMVRAIKSPGGWREMEELETEVKEAVTSQLEKRKKQNKENIN